MAGDDESFCNSNRRRAACKKAIFLIIATEFCERFSFCGLRTILSLYLRDIVGYPERAATVIYHIFIMMCYCVTVLGAVVADSCIGRFRTIKYFSMFYATGNVVLALGAIPPLHLSPHAFTMAGLALIAIGTGGIKPCVAAFGGDQFRLPAEQDKLKYFFSIFYFMINVGGFIGMLVIPVIRREIHCFGTDSCYALGFGLPAILMITAVILFVSGERWYKVKSPKGNIIVQFFRCSVYALIEKKRRGKEEKLPHWLDYASKRFDKKLISDMKTVLAILYLFTPLPLFWSAFDQQGSRWTFQASRTDTRLWGINMIPDQMQIINPIMVLALIPLFEKSFYPWCRRRLGLFINPLEKMYVGGFIAAISFVAAGIVELYLEETYPIVPMEKESQLMIVNLLPCDIELKNPFNSNQQILANQKFVFEDIGVVDPINISLGANAAAMCGPLKLSNNSRDALVNLHPGGVTSAVIMSSQSSRLEVVQIKNEEVQKSASGRPRLRVVILARKVLRSLLEVHIAGISIRNDITPVHTSRWLELEAAQHPYKVNGAESGCLVTSNTVELRPGGVYSLVVQQLDTELPVSSLVVLTPPNTVHLLWLLPQFLLVSVGEIMFAIAGLEFTFTQAPKSMKTITIAAWYLAVAMGNLVVILITKLNPFGRQSTEFFFYSLLLACDVVVFMVFASQYQHVSLERDSTSLLLRNGSKGENGKTEILLLRSQAD